MTKEYQGFAISNFRTGFDEAVEPWLLPRDAFQVLKNCHLYRGVVEKVPGYSFFAQMSDRRLVGLSGTIDGVNKTFTATLSPRPSTNNITVQATIDAGATLTETFTDDGTQTLTGSNGGSGTVNYTTGAVSVTFGAAAPTDQTFGGVQYNCVIMQLDSYASPARPIMGIKQYISPNGGQDVLVFDTRRVSKIVPLLNTMATLQESDYGLSGLPRESQINNITYGNGTVGPFTGTFTAGRIIPGSIVIQIFDGNTTTANLVDTITDNGAGLLSGSTLDAAGNNRINYLTGAFRMKFTVNQPAANTIWFSACIYGDIFSGDFTNFVSLVNYQGKAFYTNAVDPPRYWDGVCNKYLNTNLTLLPNTIAPYDISKVLHVTVNRERLLLVSYFVDNVPALNSIAWSVAGNPLDFTNDEQLYAPTSEIIRAFSFINTDMVVRFSNSERVFRYTGDAFSPFRWDSTNVIWRCDASYSAINYDSWFSSVGLPAIVGSDGVNVRRVDEIIPDFTLNLRVPEQQPVLSIDQGSIGQCYGERFDDFKEGWLCYKSYTTGDDITGPSPSDSVLAFNYLDSTYAVYTFPFSCLGFGRVIAEDVWGNNFDIWGGGNIPGPTPPPGPREANYTWGSYTQTMGALIDLAGDQNGIVYELGNGNSITDESGNVVPCLFEAITKDFNPFVEEGQLARLGYVDFLVSSNDDTTFRVQFYLDNKMDTNFNTYYQETSLSLTANGQSKIWKRIYVGAVGKEHTMRIYQNADDFASGGPDQPLRIHAIVPYFKAAGRIFQ